MASQKFLVAGNWKMNGSQKSCSEIVERLNAGAVDFNKVEVVVAPPALYVSGVRTQLKQEIGVAGQNCQAAASGAYTGEISPHMLKDVGASWVIIGHSERREKYEETNEIVASKVHFALSNGMNVMACIGETRAQRDAGDTFLVLLEQLQTIFGHNEDMKSAEFCSRLVIAYEPVWAIGTGLVATPAQAQEVHSTLRKWIFDHIGAAHAHSIRILYGGSVTAANCKQLAAMPDIDGFLVGGASLKPEFIDICNARQ